jgi:hypothetical protein
MTSHSDRELGTQIVMIKCRGRVVRQGEERIPVCIVQRLKGARRHLGKAMVKVFNAEIACNLILVNLGGRP